MNRKSRINGWKLALSIILCGMLMLFITASAGDPVTFTLSGGSVAENAGAGVHVGDFQLTSADSNPVYSLAGGQGDNGSFNIDGASLYTAASFDYEDGSSYTVVVDVTADNEGVGQETFSVDVSNISPSASSFSITVDEDGSKSGTLPLSGDDTSVSFSVASDPGKGSVDVNGSTGGYIYTPMQMKTGMIVLHTGYPTGTHPIPQRSL